MNRADPLDHFDLPENFSPCASICTRPQVHIGHKPATVGFFTWWVFNFNTVSKMQTRFRSHSPILSYHRAAARPCLLENCQSYWCRLERTPGSKSTTQDQETPHTPQKNRLIRNIKITTQVDFDFLLTYLGCDGWS